jgi:hypothetical protein
METVLDRNTVTRCKASRVKPRHVKITRRPKRFFRHLSNSCYASHPVFYKTCRGFPDLSSASIAGTDTQRHANNKATFILLFSTLTGAPPGASQGAQASLRLLEVFIANFATSCDLNAHLNGVPLARKDPQCLHYCVD